MLFHEIRVTYESLTYIKKISFQKSNSSTLGLEVLSGGQALLQGVAVVLRQRSTASVTAQNVNGRMVVAVDLLVQVAVLLELGHVVLDGPGSASGLVHALLERSRSVRVVSILNRLASIGPVGPGDTEQSTDLSVAGQRLVAVAHGLADASQADLSDWGWVGRHRIVLDDLLLLLSLLLLESLLLGKLLRGQLELLRIEQELRRRLGRERRLLGLLLLSGVSN